MYGIGPKISDLIRERHMTLSSVAKQAKLARETLSGIVNGNQTPRRNTIEKIAKVLKIDPDILLNPPEADANRKYGRSPYGLQGFSPLPGDASVNIPVLLAKVDEIGEMKALSVVLKMASKGLKEETITGEEYEAYVNLMVKLMKSNHE
jgi:transcriptional regulator with XRE-family HTH domain